MTGAILANRLIDSVLKGCGQIKMMTKINKENDDGRDYENVLSDGIQRKVVFIVFSFQLKLWYFNSYFSSDVAYSKIWFTKYV